MAGNKRSRRLKLNLSLLFPRFRTGRNKSSSDISKLKNKEVLRDDGGPSCSQTEKKRKSWRVKNGKHRRILVNPLLKRLAKSFSRFGFLSCSERARKYFCGCLLKRTMCESPNSDQSDPEKFSHENIRNLLENNNFYMNSSIQRRIEQELSGPNRENI